MTSLTFICITKMASYQLDVFMWFDRLVTLHMHTKFRLNWTSGFWDAKQRECVCGRIRVCVCVTVRADIFAVVLFSRISRVKPSRKFPLQFMSIYSNDNISKIAKLTTRELPHLAKTAKITVRENNGVYSILYTKTAVARNAVVTPLCKANVWLCMAHRRRL